MDQIWWFRIYLQILMDDKLQNSDILNSAEGIETDLWRFSYWNKQTLKEIFLVLIHKSMISAGFLNRF